MNSVTRSPASQSTRYTAARWLLRGIQSSITGDISYSYRNRRRHPQPYSDPNRPRRLSTSFTALNEPSEQSRDPGELSFLTSDGTSVTVLTESVGSEESPDSTVAQSTSGVAAALKLENLKSRSWKRQGTFAPKPVPRHETDIGMGKSNVSSANNRKQPLNNGPTPSKFQAKTLLADVENSSVPDAKSLAEMRMKRREEKLVKTGIVLPGFLRDMLNPIDPAPLPVSKYVVVRRAPPSITPYDFTDLTTRLPNSSPESLVSAINNLTNLLQPTGTWLLQFNDALVAQRFLEVYNNVNISFTRISLESPTESKARALRQTFVRQEMWEASGRTVLMRNLPMYTSANDILRFFDGFSLGAFDGILEKSVLMLRSQVTYSTLGMALVKFRSELEAHRAVRALHGALLKPSSSFIEDPPQAKIFLQVMYNGMRTKPTPPTAMR